MQVLQNYTSGQGVDGIITWTNNAPKRACSWTQGFCRVDYKQVQAQGHQSRNEWVAVENTSLVQNEKEVDALKSTKEQHYVFA